MKKKIILLFIILSVILTACKNEEPINKTLEKEDENLLVSVSILEKKKNLLITTSFKNTAQKTMPLLLGNQPTKIIIANKQYPNIIKGAAFERNLKNNEIFQTETLTVPVEKGKEEAMIIVSYQEEGKEKEIHFPMNLQDTK